MTQDQTQYLAEKYEEMKERGETWDLRTLMSPSEPRVTVEGKDAILLAANNYLDLANDPRVRDAAMDAIERFGVGAGSDWSIAGYMAVQEELNQKIAEFKGTEAGISFQTGFSVNAGVLPQVLEEGDVFISDELNHGSIIDGIRLSRADSEIYDHRDMGDLEDTLEEVYDEYDRMLIVTDGVFSMDGDIAPLDEIQSLANEYGAMTYVDDAHGEGVLGGGHGIVSEFDVEDEVDFQMGTFSKAVGGFGGMLAGDEHVVKFAYNSARTWLLSAGYPPAVAAANKRALEIIENEPERVETLWENREYFAEEMQSMGWDIGRSETPIIPAMVGNSKKAKRLGERLFEEGIFALPIVFPMVPRSEARIRNQVSAGHSKEDLDEALRVYETVGRELDLI